MSASVPVALSPSRANDFVQCPLLFRLRTVDRLPEPPSAAAVRGTLVHAVLESLFDVPSSERSRGAADELVEPSWEALLDSRPEVAVEFEADVRADIVGQARLLVERYFDLEDPTMLHPAAREVTLRANLGGDYPIKGVIDRVDVAGDGAIRLVDYKTGKAPRPQYGASAAFQMRFYALLVRDVKGVVPSMLRLVYLGDGQIRENSPTSGDLDAAQAKVQALWDDIRDAAQSGVFSQRRSRLCDWCSFQPMCPAFGGTLPDSDPQAAARVWLGMPGPAVS
ncbi:RecB family exonuclease [Jonesia quinghaiensis]|uniref:RecB family exonuclease n=1 Tax=Jonesia quinghaiensis TaxID=262806 RepID=UPI00040EBA82|nr:PD-(D/E)XK nuclease family protein [Jonesia quinghaiensis]